MDWIPQYELLAQPREDKPKISYPELVQCAQAERETDHTPIHLKRQLARAFLIGGEITIDIFAPGQNNECGWKQRPVRLQSL